MANTKVTGDVIANGTISTVHIADDAITAAKLDSTATGITFADLTVSATTATLNLSGSNTGASLINFGDSDDGNVGRIYYDHTDNFMQFKTNDSEKLRIDSSGNVGIGNANPLAKLQITSGDSGASSAWSNADELILESSGNVGLAFQTPNTGTATIAFQDPENVQAGFIQYLHGDNALRFATNGNFERMRIDSSGNVGIGCSPSYPLEVQSGGVGTVLRAGTSFISIDPTGSAAAPSLIFNGDSNTGIYRPTTDTLGFSTAGSERMRIDSSGNVGIGIDPSYKFEIKSSGAGNYIQHFVSSDGASLGGFYENADTDALFFLKNASGAIKVEIDSDGDSYFVGGNVGIGTASPSVRLHVDNGDLRVRDSGNVALQIISSDSGNSAIQFGDDVDTNDGRIVYENTGDNMKFYTLDAEKMRIDSSGAVLIGATSALDTATRLQVSGSSSGITAVWSNADDIVFENNNNFGITLATPNTGAATIAFADPEAVNQGYIQYVHGDDYMRFATSATERMRIDSNGQVQIKATSGGDLLLYSTDTSLGSNQLIGRLGFYKSDASGSGVGVSSSIQVRSDSSIGANSYMSFHTDGGSGQQEAERMRITREGDVCIGTTTGRPDSASDAGVGISPAGKFYIYSTSDFGVYNTNTTGKKIYFRVGNVEKGTIQFNTNSVAYNTTSDYRLKENVVEMTGALNRVSQLKPSRFNFIGDIDTTVDGFLAHEVQEIVPEAISGEKDEVDEEGNPEYQGIDQSKLVPLLVGAIQELKAEIELLKTEINN